MTAAAASTTPSKSTRERIVEAAERLFADKGFYGASIGALATELDVAKASVMHHFKTKEALYDAVMERNAKALEEVVTEALEGAADPTQRARRLIRAVIDWGQRRPEHPKLVLRDLLDNTHAESSGRGHFGPVIGQILAAVKAAQHAGIIRPGPAILVLEMIMGAGSFHIATRPAQYEILGGERAEELNAGFADQMQTMLELALLSPRNGRQGFSKKQRGNQSHDGS